MSLIVTVYVNDGIVMASDSRTTLTNSVVVNNTLVKNNFPLSDTTFKTFLCKNGCGISTCGDASYNNRPIAGLLERFIETELSSTTPVTEMPQKLLDYLDKYDSSRVSIFHVCGYEKQDNRMVQHAFRVISGNNKSSIDIIQNDSHGAIWDGETVTLTKVLKNQIINPRTIDVNNLSLKTGEQSIIIPSAIVIDKSTAERYPDAVIAWDLMSIQDAIDFAKYAIETTIKTMQFQSVAKTVGGPIDILTITANGAKWIKHKKIVG